MESQILVFQHTNIILKLTTHNFYKHVIGGIKKKPYSYTDLLITTIII